MKKRDIMIVKKKKEKRIGVDLYMYLAGELWHSCVALCGEEQVQFVKLVEGALDDPFDVAVLELDAEEELLAGRVQF